MAFCALGLRRRMKNPAPCLSILRATAGLSSIGARQIRLASSQFAADPARWQSGACRSSTPRPLNPTVTCSAARGEEESAELVRTRGVPEAPNSIDVLQLQPYLQLARIDKRWLTGPFQLFLWPMCWGAGLATESGTVPDVKLLALLAVSAAILRTAACVVNDLCDKDFDAKVERCKTRPLVTGVVTPRQGWTLLGALLLLYVGVVSKLPNFSVWGPVHVALQLIFNMTYPLAKRYTYWTPAYLGLAMNWGIFLGWAAVTGTADLASPVLLPVFVASWCWCMVYETIYSHQDKNDDAEAGVKSMALLFGTDTKLWITGFATALLASLSIAGYNAALGWPFYAGAVGATTHLFRQIATVDLDDPKDCLAKFRSNLWVGVITFGGIVGGKLLT